MARSSTAERALYKRRTVVQLHPGLPDGVSSKILRRETLDHSCGAPMPWFGVIAGKRRRPAPVFSK